MRGVQVDIILPSRINLPFVLWASRAMWSQVLQHGCRIWLTPPPFDHSKLMLVDGCWVLLGSANWDSRSLRLNFEFNLECYDVELAQRLDRWSRQNAGRPSCDDGGGRWPSPAGSPARRHCAFADAVLVAPDFMYVQIHQDRKQIRKMNKKNATDKSLSTELFY